MAQRDFYVDLVMNGQQIKNVKIENIASVPDDAVNAGRIIFVTEGNTLQYANGTAYKVIATTDDIATELADYIPTSQKGVADGVASLDTSGKVPLAQLLTGNVANAVVVLSAPATTGQVLQWNGTAWTGYTLASAFIPRGSVATFDDLPELDSATVGDVYNVEAPFELGGQTYPAGTNVACVLNTESEKEWDPLGGTIDLSGYQTVDNIAQDLASPSTSTYPSTQAVVDALAGKEDAIALTPNMAVVSGADGGLEASAVTATELGYLDGVTSAIQTQLDGKVTALGTGPTAGTYTKVTINASGLVTAGANLEAGDIPDISASYIAVGQKGVANGVATLDGTTKVPIAQIPTGVGNGLIPVVAGAGAAGQVIVVDEEGDGFKFSTIAVNPYARYDNTITGDNTTTEWTFAHGLGKIPATVEVSNAATGAIVEFGVTKDETNVVITSNVAIPTGTNFKVVITG